MGLIREQNTTAKKKMRDGSIAVKFRQLRRQDSVWLANYAGLGIITVKVFRPRGGGALNGHGKIPVGAGALNWTSHCWT